MPQQVTPNFRSLGDVCDFKRLFGCLLGGEVHPATSEEFLLLHFNKKKAQTDF